MEGVKGVEYAPMPAGMYENGKKMGGFTHFLTMRVAQEMLGAPTVGGGSAWPGSGGGGSQRSQITLPSLLECKNTEPKLPVSHTY